MDVIHLAETSGKTIVEIEKDLGLSRSLLNRWHGNLGLHHDTGERWARSRGLGGSTCHHI